MIPAAGYGTRFIPAIKSVPKEMLPIVDKPIIQHVVEEATSAGLKDVIIITRASKRLIEDHFDYPTNLVKVLQKVHKTKEIECVTKIAGLGNFTYIRQKGPMGTASAIKSARQAVDNEPFLVLYGDDFVLAKPSRTKQLLSLYNKYHCPILCGIRTDNEKDASQYAFAEEEWSKNGVTKIKRLIEKPGKSRRPSNLAIVSGYILTPQIFWAIDTLEKKLKPGKELMYTDAINLLAQTQPIYVCEIKNATYFDTGNKLEYLKTLVQFSLAHKKMGPQLRRFIQKLQKKL